MSRYVDIDDVTAKQHENSEVELGVLAYDYDEIDAMPFLDIVRCKECKYKRIYDDGDTKYYYCALEDRPNRQWSVDDTDYCSWGEREDDES